MIKSVIFDLGKVIVPFDFSRGYRGLEKVSTCPAAEIPLRLGKTDLVQRFESGLIEPEDFVEQLRQTLELKVTYEQFCEIWGSIFLPDTLVPDSLIEGLARRYRLVMLSNTNAIHFPLVEQRYPILRHFHERVLSHEVRALKPSPVIYREAIARAQCRPEECFFTDDIAEYVEGAKREGIDAVQFESSAKLERDLRARGILWE